ncbi:hypothetical protein D3C73_1164230 [compost metagenome]
MPPASAGMACAAPKAMQRATAASILFTERALDSQRFSHLSDSMTADMIADTSTGFPLSRSRPSSSASSKSRSDPGIHIPSGGGRPWSSAAFTATSNGRPFFVPPWGCSANGSDNPSSITSSSNLRNAYRS